MIKPGRQDRVKDLLYKKDVMILRTKFGQKSTPNFDLFNRAVEQFKRSQHLSDDNVIVLIEVLMSNLLDDNRDLVTRISKLLQTAPANCALPGIT